MDYDSSKENIQPLRGGRNPLQLSIALNAQDTEEGHRELLQQKEEYENAIRNYEGEDPLKNWYNYISWVEQSFPKHGYEGSLLTLLEDCLSKFEHDKRYYDDRRLCKLFIKYIDIQQNPLELYQILYARGLCRGIADLYKAWAYYHEAVGDYKSADSVFQMGKRELAQPASELDIAHKNLIFAAGVQVISGTNEARLIEQRLALTSLQTYKPGVVGSVRMCNDQVPIMPCTSTASKSNKSIPIYQDVSEELLGATALLPSILNIARRQDPKENLLEPGVWTQSQSRKTSTLHGITPFKIHEDKSNEPQLFDKGLRLPVKFYPLCNENYSNWTVDRFVVEPYDQTKIPMYPKALVYSHPTTEYSIEELKAQNYLNKRKNSVTEESIVAVTATPLPPPELPTANLFLNNVNHNHEEAVTIPQLAEQSLHHKESFIENMPVMHHSLNYHEVDNYNLQQNDHSFHNLEADYTNTQRNYQSQPPFAFYTDEVLQPQVPQEHHVMQNPYLINNYQYQESQPSHLNHSQNYVENNPYYPQQKYTLPHDIPTVSTHQIQSTSLQHGDDYEAGFKFEIYNSLFNLNDSKMQSSFGLCEGTSNQIQVPRGTALKTPLKDISTDDLAETGSRGGLEIAAAAQPCDEAKRITIFEDNFDTYTSPRNNEFDESLNTQTFNFHINTMQVSTPNVKMPFRDCVEARQSTKLTTIREESAGYDETGGSIHKNNISPSVSLLARHLADENNYHYNLAQNRKANEELRTSLLEFMDCESNPSSPVTESLPQPPVIITPLEYVPTDPFKPALIKTLLDKVAFPGHHRMGYNLIHHLPKLCVKKEAVIITQDRYFIEKVLGKGTYASVFKAINATTKQVVALKSQKPPNKWEYYICRELQVRLAKHPLRDRFMNIEVGYYSDQSSIIVSKYGPNGSLLDLANAIKQKFGRTMKESICIYFCIEMLKIVEAMHKVKIIHADIKPDNFLVFLQDNNIQLQLIDFGCSIDMTLLPENATFSRQVKTENFICCEMLDGRPWNYHTDLYCIGATAHVLLFDKYITLQKIDNQWSLTQKFTRYWNIPVWTEFFNALLNQQNSLANSKYLQTLLEDNLHNMNDFNSDLRALRNILKNR